MESSPADADPLTRLRSLCEMLPESAEIDSFGRPTFRAATKGFAAFDVVDGRPTVVVKMELDEQAARAARHGFEPEEETGVRGWTLVDVEHVGWDELDRLVVASYRLVASDELVLLLDSMIGRPT
jgi:predicted DNA-binding protein (MmcQ/YjbR family)